MGWQQQTRRRVEVAGTEPVVVATFKRGENAFGYLFFTGMNADGSVPRSLGDTRLQRWLSPFIPTIMDDMAETSGVGQTAMIQYWHVSNQSMSRDEIEEVAISVAKVRDEARGQLTSS